MSINFTQSFSIKPDSPRVKQIRSLQDFINQYPDEELIPSLIMLNQKYQYYRPICGDGNCFYRACIFFYFTSVDLNNYRALFPYAPIKNCINMPFEFDDFNVEQVLNYIWRQYLLPISKSNSFERQKELGKHLNSSVLLDAFLIAYFRSLNHQYITNHLQKFSAFGEDDDDKQFTSVLTYSRESQGIELYAMAQLLNLKITIMMVHPQNFQQIVYTQGGKNNNILFYRPGHYDIICTEEEYQREASFIRKVNNPPPIMNKWSRLLPNPKQPDIVKINNIQDLNKISKIRNAKKGKPIQNTNQFPRAQKIQDLTFTVPQPSRSPNKKQIPPKIQVNNQIEHKSLITNKFFKGDAKSIPNINTTKISMQIFILLLVLTLGVATYALA